MKPRTIVFAIGLTAVAAFFAALGTAALIKPPPKSIVDAVVLCGVVAVLICWVVFLVLDDREEEARGFDVETKDRTEEQ
ncbi:MAG TPA: hypothetical protein VIM11_00285 [Tepidisphaeraceae bacterium]|jgi:heme/copper-type cytochrome/quinol oxidase subunit 4